MRHWILRRLRGWMSPTELYTACKPCPLGGDFEVFSKELQALINAGEIKVYQWTVSGFTIPMLATKNYTGPFMGSTL